MTYKDLMRAVPAHAAMGACLGLFVFLFTLVANTGGVRDLVLAAANPRETMLVLACVCGATFAVGSGLTGLLFLAHEHAHRD
jgi:hypothetical protein